MRKLDFNLDGDLSFKVKFSPFWKPGVVSVNIIRYEGTARVILNKEGSDVPWLSQCYYEAIEAIVDHLIDVGVIRTSTNKFPFWGNKEWPREVLFDKSLNYLMSNFDIVINVSDYLEAGLINSNGNYYLKYK